MFNLLRRIFNDREFKALLVVVIIILIVGMLFYSHIEHWRLLDSLYFSVITLTTVGYGDFTPHTDAGKIFTMIYIFLGLGVIFTLVSIIAKNTTRHYIRLTEGYIKRTEQYFEDVLEKTVRKIDK